MGNMEKGGGRLVGAGGCQEPRMFRGLKQAWTSERPGGPVSPHPRPREDAALGLCVQSGALEGNRALPALEYLQHVGTGEVCLPEAVAPRTPHPRGTGP